MSIIMFFFSDQLKKFFFFGMRKKEQKIDNNPNEVNLIKNNTTTTALTLDYPMWTSTLSDELIFKYQTNPNFCVIAKERETLTKIYLLCTYEDFFRVWNKVPIYKQFYAECSLNVKPCKLFYDIECSTQLNRDKFQNKIEFFNLIKDIIIPVTIKKLNEKLMNNVVNDQQFIILSACSNEKYSAHVVLNSNVYFKTSNDLCEFTRDIIFETKESIKIKDKHGLSSMIDTNTFSSLRLLKSGKQLEPNRIFTYYYSPMSNFESIQDTMLTYIPSTLKEYYLLNYKSPYTALQLKEAFINNHVKSITTTTTHIPRVSINNKEEYRDCSNKYKESFELIRYYYKELLHVSYDQFNILQIKVNNKNTKYIFTLSKELPCLIHLINNKSEMTHHDNSGVSLVFYRQSGFVFPNCFSTKCNGQRLLYNPKIPLYITNKFL